MAEGTFDRLAYPAEYRGEIERLALLVDGQIDLDPASTVTWSGEELRIIELAEGLVGHTLHKGHPLHNIGVAVYAANPTGARIYFMAAHAEDARTWVNRRPRLGFLAARMLRDLFAFTNRKIGQLAQLARRAPALPPLEAAQVFSHETWLPDFEDPLPSNRTAADLIAIDPFDRVFVGGSYRFAWGRILDMARGVTNAGREPIVVAKFETRPSEDWRDKSFRILDECPTAVFDVTVQDNPGHWPEIEHIAQLAPRPTLFAYNTDDRSREFVAAGTFPTKKHIPELDYLPFDTHDVLRSGVSQWLLVKHPRVTPSIGHVGLISQAKGSASPGPAVAVGSNSNSGGAIPSPTLPTTSGYLSEPLPRVPDDKD